MRQVQKTVAAGLFAMTATCPIAAQTVVRHFAIAPQPLSAALKAFAEQSGTAIMAASKLTAGRQASAVEGDMRAVDALARMLVGTGLHVERIEGTYVLRPDATSRAADPSPPEITVTGSRIRGAPSSSLVITLSRQQIVDSGQSTLADALRNLPENFGGGQNPGITLGAASANPLNGNGTGGSAIDLRGLGPDATLTLLNGHRIAYDGTNQGVDISTIPLAALDRIEIVADGASALYGSDAVGGVANIILRKDYDGLTLDARQGAATQGGDWQQQYSGVGGRRWANGGLILTYMHERDTGVQSSERDFTDYMLDPNTLLPEQRSDSLVVSGHQKLGSHVTFSIDGTFNNRVSNLALGLPGSVTTSRYHARAYSVAPSINATFGPWTFGLFGTYGAEDMKTSSDQRSSSTGSSLSYTAGCLCTDLKSAEATAEGAILSLPGGVARLALGGGYRGNALESRNDTAHTVKQAERRSGYGYGELFIPLISPELAVPFVDRLSVTGAMRYEHYDDLGGVTTPKLGLLFTPTRGVDLKASWGKSFKAPLLSQEYLQAAAYLYSAAYMGGTRFPATATSILAYGSSGGLKPERATSWTTTLDMHPVMAPKLHLLASYFHVDYRDRIIQPASITAALSSPLYAAFVTYQPTVAEQQAVIGASATGLTNFSGRSYDPSTVVAVVDDYFTNIAAQTIKGIDTQMDYQTHLGAGDLSVTAQATYLNSRQRNAPGAPSVALAGTLYNPPHFKARFGVIWTSRTITASTFLNYISPVADTRETPALGGASMATIDLALRWKGAPTSRWKSHLEIAAAIQNLANEKPPYLSHSTDYYVPYDSTNYSAIGRTVALEINTRW